MSSSVPVMPNPVNLGIAGDKVIAYHRKYSKIADHLAKTANQKDPDLVINKSEEYLHFYIDKESFKSLSEIIALQDCEALAVFFGLENTVKKTQLTGCFIGVDKNGKILAQHKKRSPRSKDNRQAAEPIPVQDEFGPPYNTETGLARPHVNPVSIPSGNFLKLDSSPETVVDFFK